MARLLASFTVGGSGNLLTAAIVLTLANMVVRPVVKLVTLPLNVLTLGLFSGIAGLVTRYITTRLVPGVSISAGRFPGLIVGDFTIPGMVIPKLGMLVIVNTGLSLIYNLIYNTLSWLFDSSYA